MRSRIVIALAAAGALALAACGGGDVADDGGDGGQTVSTVAVADTDLGSVLVDDDGRTLYLFDSDPDGGTACTDACADTWPPLEGPAAAGDGADGGLLGTIERPDGATQATYGGHPLYTYAADAAAGDVNGQGVGEVWWVVDAAGEAVHDTAGAAAATSEDDGDPYRY